MALSDVKTFIAEKLRDDELWVKMSELLQYVIDNFQTELNDVRNKHFGADATREEVVKATIEELGFKYIDDIANTLSPFEITFLIDFVSLLNLLKGSREGVRIVLELLGFDAIINEWWEQDPIAEPMTFKIIVLADSSVVPDEQETVDKLKQFLREYVIPIAELQFLFVIEFIGLETGHAGFFKQFNSGKITDRL